MRLAMLALAHSLLWSASPAVEEVRALVRRQGGKLAARVDEVCRTEAEGCPTLRAELLLKQGRLADADAAFTSLLQKNPKNARALLGRARALQAISFRRTARALLAEAAAIAPDDPEILLEFAATAPRERRRELFEKYLTLSAGEPPEAIQYAQTTLSVERALNGRPVSRLRTPYEATDLKLVMLMNGSGAASFRGVGLKVSINGQRPMTLLLDTGASGISITTRAAKAIGLQAVADVVLRGIGDNPDRSAALALAETVRMGSVEFAHVPVRFADSKRFPQGEGIIGTDVFADFLVTLDFQKYRLGLEPLPQRGAKPVPEDDDLYDRVIAEDRKSFTQTLRRGSHLHIPVHLNHRSNWYPFLIDTGANVSVVDQALAAAHTGTGAEPSVRLRGLSGTVQNVQSARRLDLTFAGFEQSNEGMLTLDLAKLNEFSDFPTLGVLGMPLLRMFDLVIDYREGLVRLNYRGSRNLR